MAEPLCTPVAWENEKPGVKPLGLFLYNKQFVRSTVEVKRERERERETFIYVASNDP